MERKNQPTTNPDDHASMLARQNITRGVLAGGGLLIAIMVLLAGITISFGLIPDDEKGKIDLRQWLILECIGGAGASFLAGVVCRRVSRHTRAPLILAGLVLTVGLIEAIEILRYRASADISAPTWLIMLAPIIAAAGTLLGGFLPSRSIEQIQVKAHRIRTSDVLRFSVPLAVLVSALIVSMFVLPNQKAGIQSDVVAAALTLDFTVAAPLLVFWLLVRTKKLPWIVIIPTAVLGFALATAVIPEQHNALLDSMRLLIVPLELAIVVYLVILTRRAMAGKHDDSCDFVTRLRSTANQVLGNRIAADILTTEISILYYAFTGRGAPARRTDSFTVHRQVGYLRVIVCLMMVLLVETFAIHMLVSQWSGTVAWVFTALSIYAGLWFVGDYRAMNARPIQISQTQLLMRVGLRWETSIPIQEIVEVNLVGQQVKRKEPSILSAGLLGQPNVQILLSEPINIIGMYAIRKQAREIWLTVDNAEAFRAMLQPVDSQLYHSQSTQPAPSINRSSRQ